MTNWTAYQRALEEIVSEALAIEVREWETRPRADIGAELVSTLTAHAWRAVELLDELLELLELLGTDHGSSSCDRERWSQLCDIAFMARWDLRRRVTGFGPGEPDGDPWLLIAACSSMRRRIIKSLCEVERARCRALRIPFPFVSLYRNDRDVALETRRAYRSFIRGVRSIVARVDAGELDLHRALRLSATEVAVLIGRNIYEELRVEDRQQLRSLQSRIFAAAMVSESFTHKRVWSDVVAFAELLGQVQRRPELILHDYELVCEALARVQALRERGSLESAWVARLALLEGRDRELDTLLVCEDVDAQRWYATLYGLAQELGRDLGRDDHTEYRGHDDVVVARVRFESSAQYGG
jgi:hypothetical protein